MIGPRRITATDGALLRHHQRASDGVCKIITPTAGMVDLVPTGAGCPTLQRQELTLQPIIVEQRDGAAVEERQQLPVYFRFGQLARLIRDAVAGKLLRRPFSGVSVTRIVRILYAFKTSANCSTTPDGANGGTASRTRSRTVMLSSTCAIASVIESAEPPLGSTNPT